RNLIHKAFKGVGVIHSLRLKKPGAAAYFLLELGQFDIERWCIRTRRRTAPKVCGTMKIIPCHVFSLIETRDNLEDLRRFDVKDRLGLFMIAYRDRITGQS